MIRFTRVLLIALVWIASVSSTQVRAQHGESAVGQADILNAIPHLPEEPRSLFTPAAAVGPHTQAIDQPYLLPDPLLDPPQLPGPGWFFNLDVLGTKAHINNQLSTQVPNPLRAGVLDQVGLPAAPVNWTVSPRFELGYRLPSGFGEIALSYRYLATQGTELVVGDDGPARLSSLLDLNQIDLQYASREFSIWPSWDMRWHLGLRYADLYFDSRADESMAQALAGNGVYQTRTTNSYVGFGPLAGVELERALGDRGFSFVTKAEFALLVGRIRQQFIERGAGAPALDSVLSVSSTQGVPVLNVQAGVGYQPTRFPGVHVFLGYAYEHWWEAGELNNINNQNGTFGEISSMSVVFRAELNF